MISHRVGQPYQVGKTVWPEGGEYHYRLNTHELRLCYSPVTETVKHAVRKGPAEFALVVEASVIYFLYRFGEAIPWTDIPFLWHLVIPSRERTLLPELRDEETVLLHLVLIDAHTGITRVLRSEPLTPFFSRALVNAIRQQAALPFDDPRDYVRHLQDFYTRYPHTPLMLLQAVARCQIAASTPQS